MNYQQPHVPNPSVPSPASQTSGYQPVTFEAQGPAQAHQYHNYASYQQQYQQAPPANIFQECQQPIIQQRQVRELPVLQKEALQPPQKLVKQHLLPTTPITVTPAPDPIHEESPPLDYQVLLISLAEDYFTAAHRQGSLVALSTRIEDLDRYYKLIAFGLGCLETILKQRLQPRLEAAVRLRYATVLHDETENTMEAETALSKGNRLLDLKYSIQHLLVRVMFKKTPKASMKALDIIIKDSETCNHFSWLYAFRFLRAFLLLELSSPSDVLSAMATLRSISSTAEDRRDTAVFLISSVLEALGHLRSQSKDSIEQAQHALASARSLQLDQLTAELPQLVALTYILDLICSLMQGNQPQAEPKLQALHIMLDQRVNDNHWTVDGTFSVPIHADARSQTLVNGSKSRLSSSQDGAERLTFTWLPKRDIYALVFFLSGVTVSPKNTTQGLKAETFLKEGLKVTMDEINTPPESGKVSLSTIALRLAWRKTLVSHIRLHLAFALCVRTDWDSAIASLKELEQWNETFSPDPAPGMLPLLTSYLAGVIYQGIGNLTGALSIFQGPQFSVLHDPSFDLENNANRISHDSRRDVSILASLNSILILRGLPQPDQEFINKIFSRVEPFCVSHSDQNIKAAYYFIKAIYCASDPLIKSKQFLQHALKTAKGITNNQLTFITLNFMSWKFFRGVVGEQAEKSSRASLRLAKKGMDGLWTSVAEGMLADSLEVQGKMEEARSMREEAIKSAETIVPRLRKAEGSLD
ncbi:hypothetical protein FGG08_007152 [Glutinoglossum americanum]|uniref:MAU2 chromatid cohesion factor homolog n=1 Tax=Glutinoglossum americanum TaxID=1670608 RepID=A0A9P8HRD0_9PEZI|nr:hypothetical protein FGG08_007152 [Glutinoglossum americanum]